MDPARSRSDVRTHILDTAYGLLAEHGAGHLTQPRLSKAAGVRQSHLTYYFPTRGDLLAAVARHSMEILSRPLLARAQKGALKPDQIPVVLTAALTDRRRLRVILGLIAAADEDPNVRNSLRRIVRLVRARLSALFAMLSLPHDDQTIALVHTFVVGAAVLNHARADAAARREAEAAIRFVTNLVPQLGKIANTRPRRGSKKRTSHPREPQS